DKTTRRNRFQSSPPSSPVVGVDVNDNFKPHYEIIPGKEKIVKELREAAAKAEKLFLATDPDREGEAIAWHLKEELGKPDEQTYRILFNELTERRIKEAIASPTRLNADKYNAQQARRILDRIVGYQLSPLLWEKVQSGLSAGRVQSVALRIIVDRQDAIDKFTPQEYWTITAALKGERPPAFQAKLVEIDGEKSDIRDLQAAQAAFFQAQSETFVVSDVQKKERSRKPPAPFITSTLQQEASKKLRFTGTRTMRIAQQLYEGIELGSEGAVGLITYMRTDSTRVAPEAIEAVRQYIATSYGPEYLPAKPHTYKVGKSAQEAHEAIRPTSMERPPEKVAPFLDKAQLALYTLIWNRFVASQAAPAIFDMTTVVIAAGNLRFRAAGAVMRFDGFTRIYSVESDEETEGQKNTSEESAKSLPVLHVGERLTLVKLDPRQHFTQPPPMFNEASLIKELEELGIGRPSTYAEIISTIQKRKYVEIEDKKFRPTLLGRIISSLLVDNFPRLLDTQFTAQMESSLDRIEDGEISWTETLRDFYEPFQEDIKLAKQAMQNIKKTGLAINESCPKCGQPLLIRSGRFGLFLGCSGYPDCAYTSNIQYKKPEAPQPLASDQTCDCGAPMVMKTSSKGSFLACSRYPECKVTKPLGIGVACPKCAKGELVRRRSKKGRFFYGCSRYPDCDYIQWNRTSKTGNEKPPESKLG
ncbi:MAG: type I DNA topoisomerase, partial [Desulfomonilaceae bacterium]